MKLENLSKLVDSYLLTPNSKHNSDNLYLKRMPQRDGSLKWGIFSNGTSISLNAKLLLFCFEPANCDKDEVFFSEHRFACVESALIVLKKYLECDWSAMPEFKDEHPNQFIIYKKTREVYKNGLADLF